MPADNTVDFYRYVILRLDSLSRDGCELDLDVCTISSIADVDRPHERLTDDPDLLGAHIDLDQPRIDGFVELSESADKTWSISQMSQHVKVDRLTDRALVDLLERVGEGTTGDHADGTDAGS